MHAYNLCTTITAADPCSTNVCARTRLDVVADCAFAVWLCGVDMPIECKRPHCVRFVRICSDVCPWHVV